MNGNSSDPYGFEKAGLNEEDFGAGGGTIVSAFDAFRKFLRAAPMDSDPTTPPALLVLRGGDAYC